MINSDRAPFVCPFCTNSENIPMYTVWIFVPLVACSRFLNENSSFKCRSKNVVLLM